ncbi:AbrB/MazE/SpoVT family DNA-binding domain-containing protein [Desulfotomaculum nigrificans]|uniref:AbrB/MazE/SpoVT family DNA-binding domain-containing protein n=1 Tax=Desulfotomaculum nigrificans TaxID=1565 RepID=UPI0001FAEB51|nr:AbrB/MazE/SpoVT family DNA-binding domain-containing protein [Desulfotomaculum nigrificans]
MEARIIFKNYRPKKVRVRNKGQFTIPVEFREKMGIREDTVLDVYSFGKVIIATPEKPVVKELAAAVREGMKEYKVNLDELLAELREGRHEYVKED